MSNPYLYFHKLLYRMTMNQQPLNILFDVIETPWQIRGKLGSQSLQRKCGKCMEIMAAYQQQKALNFPTKQMPTSQTQVHKQVTFSHQIFNLNVFFQPNQFAIYEQVPSQNAKAE